MCVILSSPSGTSAVVEMGNYSNRFVFDVEVVTRSGAVVALRDLHQIEIYADDAKKRQPLIGKKEVTIHSDGMLRAGSHASGYGQELDQFFSCVRDGIHPPSSLEMSMRIYDIIDKIVSSAK